MENLINETNGRLQAIIHDLQVIGREYEDKLNKNIELIEIEKNKANQYKTDFARAEAKVSKMNKDIEGFENDYNHLVEKFKDDELSNILVAANREISAKIDERKKLIIKDQIAMNSLVQKAESVKTKLVKLYAEKKVLEYCYQQIVDAYEYYSTELSKIISYADTHRDFLCACYAQEKNEEIQEEIQNNNYTEENDEDYSNITSDIIEDVLDNPAIDDEIDTNDNSDSDDDFIYLDNLDLDEDDNLEEMDLTNLLESTSKELDEITDGADDLFNYLEIDDKSLDDILNHSDDLDD